jgi:hypothetical protein
VCLLGTSHCPTLSLACVEQKPTHGGWRSAGGDAECEGLGGFVFFMCFFDISSSPPLYPSFPLLLPTVLSSSLISSSGDAHTFPIYRPVSRWVMGIYVWFFLSFAFFFFFFFFFFSPIAFLFFFSFFSYFYVYSKSVYTLGLHFYIYIMMNLIFFFTSFPCIQKEKIFDPLNDLCMVPLTVDHACNIQMIKYLLLHHIFFFFFFFVLYK